MDNKEHLTNKDKVETHHTVDPIVTASGEKDYVVKEEFTHYPHYRNHEATIHSNRGHHRVGNNLSWRAVLAGLVTFIALSMVFSLIGAAIGLGAPDVTAAKPLEGVGMGLILWTVLSLILSLAGAGYIAGFTATRAGMVHGFLTWALSLIATTMLASSALSGAFNTIGAMLGATGRAAGDVVGTVADTAGSLSEDAFNAIADQLQIDTANLDTEVENVLQDTDIEQLQPNYLQNQLDETVTDIQNAAKSVVVDQKPIDEAFQDVFTNIQERVDTIGQGLNRDQIAEAVAKNTDLTEAEAEEATDNIMKSYEDVQKQTQDVLKNAETQIDQLQQDTKQVVEKGKETTETVMNEASKYSVYAFIASVLGMLISTFAGKKGAEKDLEEDQRVLEFDREPVVK